MLISFMMSSFHSWLLKFGLFFQLHVFKVSENMCIRAVVHAHKHKHFEFKAFSS
jgi:hypothetical protein